MEVKHSVVHQIKRVAKSYGIKGVHDVANDDDDKQEFTFKDQHDKWYLINLKTKQLIFN